MEHGRQLKRKCEDVGGFHKKSKHVEKDPAVNDLDYFSKLNDDCLLEIFSYLDVADLARLSAMSQRLRTVTKKPLSSHFYAKVDQIGLIGKKCGNVVICVSRKDESSGKVRRYEISESGIDGFLEIDEDLWNSPSSFGSVKQPVPSSVITRLGAIMRIIRPQVLCIKNVLIDEDSLIKFKKIFGRMSHVELDCSDIRFGEGQDPNVARKFMQWVISTCPSRISLWNMDMHRSNAIDVDFFRNLSEAVPRPHLSIIDFRFRDELTLLTSTDDLDAILPRMATLKADFLIVRTERLMSLALERFRTDRVGIWQMGTTRKLEKEDIEAGVGKEFKIDQVTRSNEGRHYIMKKVHSPNLIVSHRSLQIAVVPERNKHGGPAEYAVRIFFF